ncbi:MULTISPECIES: hypothetical protein [Pseudoalteromonas]|mgnify:CR=1 FL=1|jgi:hypothetical protein|uniref:hypothetical protein n=1 Tax=Pseudoalteromonas TaxID=53246 RepID=UPI0007C498F2|nr:MULTISPECIES: hypothetical protein [Pseudoalteromonas]MBN4057445.1 hypothetical protein [Pseudoalteromonas haloplanktis]TMO26960.1 hypothetical protein CWC28_12075 [Pseudoalteromonas sp. S4492]
MKRIISAAIFLILAGCQQPTVYVYTENLDEQQLLTLEQALTKQSLPYEYTKLPIPRDFADATLMLSSDKILTHETEQLAEIMQRLGYQAEIKYTTDANHFYNQGNIGFYLRAKNGLTGFTMPARVITTGCVEDKFNGLAVTFSDKQAEFNLASGRRVSLEWDYLYGYLVIYYKNYSQSYSHLTPEVSTPFGMKPSDTYRYTARVNSPSWLNCSLQIVYMD